MEYSFVPSDIIGKGIQRKKFYALSSGRGAVRSSTLDNFFHGTTSVPGIEGTAALWTTEPGRQRVTFEIVSWEKDVTQDTFKIWDGETLIDLVDRSAADTRNGRKWTSGDLVVEFDTISDEWGILALDTGDRRGASQIRIKSVEWLSPPDPVLEPPHLFEESNEAYVIGSIDPLTGFYLGESFVGTINHPDYGLVVDELDNFSFSIAYGECLEGLIYTQSTVGLEFNIFDNSGNVITSGIVEPTTPLGFGLEFGEYTLKVNPLDLNTENFYSLSLELGQAQYY